MHRRKLFCEYGPVCYRISVAKECLRRRLWDLLHQTNFARSQTQQELPVLVKGHVSPILRRLEGVDMRLQQNKAENLRIAIRPIDHLLIRPGESFSFWQRVGRCTARRGYLPGLAISNGTLREETGGGLCQLANLIHYLVLHSPLTVTELHHHSDALFPDSERRVPFGTGTSVFYRHVDYRFRNDTDQPVQLLLWIEDGLLCGELRAQTPFPLRYRLVEENSHYTKEEDGYYRNSRVYRRCFEVATGKELPRELLLVNHSKVLYDPALIPPESLKKEEAPCR